MATTKLAASRRRGSGTQFESPVARAQMALCEAIARVDRARADRIRKVVDLHRQLVAVERDYLDEIRGVKNDLVVVNLELSIGEAA